MRFSIRAIAALALLAPTAPLLAQEAEADSAVTVTGGVTLTTDYRFRGISQSAEDLAVQGTINVNSWAPDNRTIAFVSYRLKS